MTFFPPNSMYIVCINFYFFNWSLLLHSMNVCIQCNNLLKFFTQMVLSGK
jgi:hypothetical protein